MFNIYNIIPRINHGYRLYFNSKTKTFEIVNIYNNYEICYTFKSFFKNIINDLHFSKIENYLKNLKMIENYNNNLFQNKKEKTHQDTADRLYDFYNFTKRSNNITTQEIYKITEA